jgi:hypothetical protein
MSNKPHLRPHQKERHASRITRLLVAILIVCVFVLVIALELTGHIIFRGRLSEGRFRLGSRKLVCAAFGAGRR